MTADTPRIDDSLLDEPLAPYWAVNVVLIVLGAAVLTTAFTFLDPLDPRPAYNPWTYAIATPIALLLLSAILGMVVSRRMEKTMQVAFLLSVLVHLLLLVYAMNVVIFSRMWPRIFDAAIVQRHQLEQQQLRAREYYQFSSARRVDATPEYLRPVPTQVDAVELEMIETPALQLARNSSAHLPTPVPRIQREVAPHLIERETEAVPTATSELLPANLSRSDRQQSPQLDAPTDAPSFPATPDAASAAVRNQASAAELRRPSLDRSMANVPRLRIPIEPSRRTPDRPAGAAVAAALMSMPAPDAVKLVPRARPARLPPSSSPLETPLVETPPPRPSPHPERWQATRSTGLAAGARVAPPTRMAPPKADARPATPALPAASVRSAGLPDPGDLANAPRRIDVAGGRPAPPPAASMPVIGVPSTGSPTPRSAPRPSPDTALERSSLAGPAHGAAPSPGQMAAAQWSGRLRPAIGREPRGTLQPIAADGQAATADVAALFGTGKSFERSVAGLAAPIGGSVASPTASVALPTDAADNEHARMDAASDTDRPPVEPTAVGPQSLAALSAAPPATPMADHIADNELLEQGVRRLAVAPGSAGTSGENSGAAAASHHNSLFGRSNHPATAPPSSLAGPPSAQSPTPDDASGEPTSSERARSEPAALARRSDQHSGVRRDSATALINPPLQIDAERGAGGVEVAPESLGTLLARNEVRMHAEPETDLRTQRFPRAALGGPLTAGTPAPVPTPAFQQRLDRLRDPSTSQHRATQPQTELAIERGLEFLARYQRPDGSWRLQDFDTRVLIRSDTAATGLALLAFQGAGYTHLDLKYADVVGKAIEYLRTHQQPNGDLYVRQDPASDQNAWLYSHAIAALALTESYGMTQDPEIRPAAQRAVDFITAAQDTRRGGWRYRPGAGSDTSVSGWFMMALQSARLAGLDAPQSTIDRLHNYLDQSQAGPEQPYLYRYNPFAPDTPQQRHGLQPTPVMTSVGLLMRLYLGWHRDQPAMQAGADYLLQHLPENGTIDQPRRDTYYWYYATQVIFHVGGDHWRIWHDRLYPLLIGSQVADGPLAGSWDPDSPTPDLWGRWGGRLYVTTMNLLSLEVSYRHLPLYDATAQ